MGTGGAASEPIVGRVEEDFSDGIMLGGVDDPAAVLSVDDDLLEGGSPEELLERDFWVLKLPWDKRRRSLKNDGILVEM